MVNGSDGYSSWFPLPYSLTDKPEESNIFWFEGGCDIAPWLYKEKAGSQTYFSEQGSKHELNCYNIAKKVNAFCIGTCKGFQNLAVYHGATMAQHMRHPHSHLVVTNTGEKILFNSMHHQNPIVDERITGLKEDKDYELIGWSTKLSPYHLNGDDQDYAFGPDYKEPEIMSFKNCWGAQAHPEMAPINSPFVKFCQKSLLKTMKRDGFID